MNIFTRLLQSQKTKRLTKAELVNGTTATFTSWNGNAYANDIYRGAVDAIARNAGKLKGAHIVKYNGEKKEASDQRLNKLLQVKTRALSRE